jgi:hypothetical protein
VSETGELELPMSDERFHAIEGRIHGLEQGHAATKEKLAVLEATIPLQLHAIQRGIDDVKEGMKTDRKAVENLEKLVSNLDNRPGVWALGGVKLITVVAITCTVTGFCTFIAAKWPFDDRPAAAHVQKEGHR